MTDLPVRMRFAASLVSVVVSFVASSADAASPTLIQEPGLFSSCGSAGFDLCGPGRDVFTNYPSVGTTVIPGATALGLVSGDVVSSFSWGYDSVAPEARIVFSVTPTSTGVAGTAPDVFSDAAIGEGAVPIYDGGTLAAPLANARLVDGDGQPDMAPPTLGLYDPNSNLSALGLCDPVTRPQGSVAIFTLKAGSPTLTALGATPKDILTNTYQTGGPISIFLEGSDVGLVAGDVIDALSFSVEGPPALISLAPGSPTLTTLGASTADIIQIGFLAPFVAVTASSMGLAPTDDIDALDVNVDDDGDVVADYCDGCPSVADNDQDDFDEDGVGDACDNCGAIANTTQDNADGDDWGDVCDNCPAVSNSLQTDVDADLIGDACDLCIGDDFGGEPGIGKPQLKFTKLGTAGREGLKVAGYSFVPAFLPGDIDVAAEGLRLHIVDLGSSDNVVLDYTIPAGEVPTVCGAEDGWTSSSDRKKQKYRNETNEIQPACTEGSALGITKAQVKHDLLDGDPLKFKIQGKGGTYGPATGPFQVTIVWGDSADGEAGHCSEETFAADDCKTNASGTAVSCKKK